MNKHESSFQVTEETPCPPVVDVCPNIDGIQEALPEGYHFDEEKNCIKNEEPIPPVATPSATPKIPKITELPNTGNPFFDTLWFSLATGGGLSGLGTALYLFKKRKD